MQPLSSSSLPYYQNSSYNGHNPYNAHNRNSLPQNSSSTFQTTLSLSQSHVYNSNKSNLEYNMNNSRLTSSHGLDSRINYRVYSQSLKQIEYIKKYRTCRPNANMTLSKSYKYDQNPIDFLPSFFCKLFNTKTVIQNNNDKQSKQIVAPTIQQHEVAKKQYAKCTCQKSQDGYCQLVIKWIDEEYYWKTDRQFTNIYEHYNRQNNQQLFQIAHKKMKQKIDILGIHIDRHKLSILTCIVANYLKHLQYYNRYAKLGEYTDIYIWVALGVFYHLEVPEEKESSEYKNNKEQIVMNSTPKHLSLVCSLAFWAIDTVINYFKDLTAEAVKQHTNKIIGYMQHYFPKWVTFIEQKLTAHTLQQIIKQWVKQMMFGYMGIQSIGFFIESHRKYGWQYLYKIILSYFQFRINALKTSQIFMTGQITPEIIIQKLIDSSEQWPMVFCQASAFNFSK